MIDREIADMALQIESIDDGTKACFGCYDKDIEALEDCVTCRRDECDCVKGELRVAKGRIEVLEERSRTHRELIDQLMACVENMEDKSQGA